MTLPPGATPADYSLSPRQRGMVAEHEASHAVAMARLGLPIGVCTLANFYFNGHLFSGYTDLVPGTLEYWVHAPREHRGEIENYAVATAAGIVMDGLQGRPMDSQGRPLDAVQGQGNDAQRIGECAGTLGIATSATDPAIGPFLANAVRRARDLLSRDDYRALRAVSDALLARETLTGDEVRALVRASGG